MTSVRRYELVLQKQPDLVNGQSYTIGPDDDQSDTVKTDADGTLVIVAAVASSSTH